ncbi:MAG: oligosaccharide flippase family protein [Prevotella sp.]|nr:oligosaccharide flippase family protein [Prevotella sp.]
MKISMNRIAKDTARLTAVSLILQGLGLWLNIFISNKLGTASVGVMTLITSLFGFIMVLANGNIFISTSRFVSEELGAGSGSVRRIMKLSLGFSLILSTAFALASFGLARIIAHRVSGAPELALAVRIIALSLPPAAAGSCIRGYFNAVRDVRVPCNGDIIEFSAKWVSLTAGVLFLLDRGLSVYLLISVSILIGETVSFVYYIIKFIPEYRRFSVLPQGQPRIVKISSYLKLSLPIAAGGYVQMIMSSLNEALVPVALLKYNASAERAMSEYGMFEAMIIPTVFYPAVILTSLSNIIIPEIARAKSSENTERVQSLIKKSLSRAFAYSFFISGMLLVMGNNIGRILCPSDSLVSETLVKMFPVVPFIYLEIVLEGIIKGLGRQNFSTLNSLCEYAIRIVCVMVFVRLYGFAGVLISYYASNVYSNIVRVVFVFRAANIRFDPFAYIVKPFAMCFFCCQLTSALTKLTECSSLILETVIYLSMAGIIFVMLYELDKRVFCSDRKRETSHGKIVCNR